MAVSVGTLLVAGSLTIVFLAAGGFIFGASVSFFWPAQTAIMGDILPAERRGNGAALLQVSLNLTRSIAPFLAAGLLAWDVTGSAGTYFFVAAIFVPVLITARLLPAAPGRASGGRNMVREMALGLQHVMENRALLEAMVSFIVVTLLGFSIMVVLPGLTKDVLGAGESGFGIMFGINAVGALIAGVCVTSLTSSRRLPALLTASGVAFGLTICLTGLMPTFALACFAMFLVGGAGGMFQTLVLARMMNISSASYLGRVMSLTNLAWSLMSLLSLGVGLLADLSSQRTVLIGVGLTLVVATLALALWSRSDSLGPEPVAVV
jgi:MFS family permease